MRTISINPENEKIEIDLKAGKVEATGYVTLVLVLFLGYIGLVFVKEKYGHHIKKIKNIFKKKPRRKL